MGEGLTLFHTGILGKFRKRGFTMHDLFPKPLEMIEAAAFVPTTVLPVAASDSVPRGSAEEAGLRVAPRWLSGDTCPRRRRK